MTLSAREKIKQSEVRPHEIFKEVEPAIVTELFTTFREEDRDVYKSALASLAQSRKLRAVFVQRKSVAEQIAWMHKTLKLRGSDTVGEHLLQVWFMKFQQPLLVRFCDGMGIEHNGEGSVEGALPDELDEDKLNETVDGLYADFNPRIVSLYLNLFNLQRPGGWEALENLISNDHRVRLGEEPEAAPAEEGGALSEADSEGEGVLQAEKGSPDEPVASEPEEGNETEVEAETSPERD